MHLHRNFSHYRKWRVSFVLPPKDLKERQKYIINDSMKTLIIVWTEKLKACSGTLSWSLFASGREVAHKSRSSPTTFKLGESLLITQPGKYPNKEANLKAIPWDAYLSH